MTKLVSIMLTLLDRVLFCNKLTARRVQKQAKLNRFLALPALKIAYYLDYE